MSKSSATFCLKRTNNLHVPLIFKMSRTFLYSRKPICLKLIQFYSNNDLVCSVSNNEINISGVASPSFRNRIVTIKLK